MVLFACLLCIGVAQAVTPTNNRQANRAILDGPREKAGEENEQKEAREENEQKEKEAGEKNEHNETGKESKVLYADKI